MRVLPCELQPTKSTPVDTEENMNDINIELILEAIRLEQQSQEAQAKAKEILK